MCVLSLNFLDLLLATQEDKVLEVGSRLLDERTRWPRRNDVARTPMRPRTDAGGKANTTSNARQEFTSTGPQTTKNEGYRIMVYLPPPNSAPIYLKNNNKIIKK